jgi:hypothetical protein
MRRRTLLLSLLAVFFPVKARAEVWQMVTDEEFEREKSSPKDEQPRIAAASQGPIITVEHPDQAKPIKPPVSILVSFRPQDGATIDLSSLRVLYGFLGIDVTKRIIEHAKLTASGLSATNAQLPAGHHKVTVQIADNRARVGSRTIDFTVV